MAEGTITRKDVISDDTLNWGAEYAKTVDAAIGKNKEFVTAIVSLADANNKLRGSFNAADFAENQKKINAANNEAIGIWKEQIQLENSLVSTKKKVELASEGTNRALIKERLELSLINKEIKQETLERLGLVSAYTKLNNARTEAKNKLRDLIASEQASTAEIKKAQKEFDILDNKVKKADRAVGDFSKNVGNYKSAFSGIGDIFGAFGIVGGVTAFAAITKDIFSTTKELQSLDLALKSVTGSQENFNAQQTFLNTIAEKYGLEIKNLTKQYTAFYVAAKDKLAAQEIQDLFENIAKSGSALGLSNETLERSFMAVNQMLSKGTVASEELRGQLAESLPGAVQAMTKAVQVLHPEIKNLTEKGLFEMIKSGKILASEVLPETARQLVILTGADKAEGIDTLTKSTNKLSNAWTNFVRQINKGDSALSGFLTGTINIMTNTIEGFTTFIKSDGEKRKDEMAYILDKQYQKQKEYLKKTKDLSTEDIENVIKFNKEKIKQNTEEVNELNKKLKQIESLQKNTPFGLYETKANQKERLAIKQKIEDVNNFTSLLVGQNKANIEFIAPKIKNNAGSTETDAERKKREAAEKKALKEKLDREKKASDDLYNLEKQRLERSIQLNNEVAKDDKEADDVRIAALEQSELKQIELANLSKQHSLDADKFVLENSKLTESERTRIKEEAANKIIDIEKKTAEEIDKINQFDPKVYEANLKEGVSKIEIAMNEELATEEEKFKALGDLSKLNDRAKEKATKDHEQKIFDIKKEFAIATAKLQIANLEAELSAFKQQSDGSKESNAIILETEKKISDAKLKLKQTEVDTFDKGEKKKVLSAKEQATLILEISSDMTGALTDLGNAFFDKKIQQIDDEISKNNEYYDRQLELAGNDERQKDLLNKEREKKNKELEDKKKKEQHKQAVFNKASAVAQAAISTALAVLNALNTKPFLPLGPIMATVAGTLGAIQLGAILATPIPKYKHGRKGGKAEFAEVGDGYVSEVITKADGSSPRITPNKPTLTFLEQGDIVHKSVDDYNRYMRASILNKFTRDNEMVKGFQMNQNGNIYGKDLLDELKRNTQAIEKNKGNIIVQSPKMDLGYEIWKMNNLNWK
jgi:tape measure domain-containing protein